MYILFLFLNNKIFYSSIIKIIKIYKIFCKVEKFMKQEKYRTINIFQSRIKIRFITMKNNII